MNQTQDKKEDLVNKILEFLPLNSETEIKIPSLGKIYSSIDPSKPITIRPMNFEDEKTIATSKGSDPLGIVLSRCVSNLPITDLIPADKMFLLLKLREVSYGDEYNFTLHCQNCKIENKASVKISELDIKYADDSFQDPIEVFLTGIKKKAKVRLMKNKDENYFVDQAVGITNLWRFVEEIDGISDKSVISEVIQKLPSKDVKKIILSMKSDIGVNTKVGFTCNSCSHVNVLELPITSDFFSES